MSAPEVARRRSGTSELLAPRRSCHRGRSLRGLLCDRELRAVSITYQRHNQGSGHNCMPPRGHHCCESMRRVAVADLRLPVTW